MSSKLAALQLAAVFLVFVLSSCGGGSGASGVMNQIPDGDYIVLMGFDTTKMFASSAFKGLMEFMGETGMGPDDYLESMSDQWEGSSVDWTRLDTALVMMSEEPDEMLMFFRSQGIEIDKFIDFMEDEWNAEIEEKEEAGLKYWWDETSKSGIFEIGGGLMMAMEGAFEEMIDIHAGKGKKLQDDPDFRDALALTDLNATLYASIWGGLGKYTRGFKRAFEVVEEDEETLESIGDALGDLEAAGVAIWFNDGLEISGKVLFDDEESAVFSEEFLKEKLKKLGENIGERREFIRIIAPFVDPHLPERLLDKIEIRRSGAVLEARLDIDDTDPVFELAKAGMEARTKLDKTITLVNRLGTAIEIYKMDFSSLPKADSLKELLEVLSDYSYYETESLSDVDAWGFPLVYEYDISDAGTMTYSLISYGADGKPGPESIPENPQNITTFVEDLIFSNGMWVQKPKY